MRSIILFAVGSALAVESEESCARLGVNVAAWIRNRPGKVYCPAPHLLMATSELTPTVKAVPFLCPLFTPSNRRIATADALALGLNPADGLIDPTSVIARAVEIGEGSYIMRR